MSRSQRRARLIGLFALVLIALLSLSLLAQIQPPAAGAAAGQPPGERSPRLSGRTLSAPGGYLTDPAPGDPLDIALGYIRQQRRLFGLTEDDLSDVALKDRYVSAHNGVTHLYLRQRLAGIELFNGDININVARDGRILNLGSGFVPNLRGATNTVTPRLGAADAIRAASAELRLPLTKALTPLSGASGGDSAQLFSDAGVSYDPIPARLMLQQVQPGLVRLAWDLTLRLRNDEDWLSLRVDAETGAILSEVNFFAHSGEYLTDAHQGQGAAGGGDTQAGHAAPARPADLAAPPALGVDDSSTYLVYELPKESPHDGGRTTVANPADLVASPYGWHDTDGQPGAEHTITRGNNVYAYADTNADNAPDGGEPDGGAGLDFAPAIDLGAAPGTYKEAATVNLFYTNNRIHDILYRLGFDEAAGNFRQTNYSGAGAGGDAVQAEAQDGLGFVNANFATPPDGLPPRMQMYLGAATGSLTIGGVSYGFGTASFGPAQFNVTGQAVIASDGGAPTTDGCQTITSDVAGKIALIDRGICSFIIKAANAQAAGAIGVILVNNVPGAAPSLGGTDPSITIPTYALSQADGATVKAAIGQGAVSATLAAGERTDGALDNGVIIHEYGHGLSNRLTGGPSNTSCLSSAEQAGEGWSDFLAMALIAQAGDTAAQPIAIGNWLFGQAADGPGIRRQPYSTDTGLNGLTYDSLKSVRTNAGSPVVHDVGEIWNTMLWEVYWELVAAHGFDADLIGGAGGNRLALQLVIDGMKLQPCNPTFVEARDGILAADVADTGGANQCLIWEGFARRGLGYSADAGSTDSHTDGTAAFDLPPLCTLEAQPAVLDACIDGPAQFTVAVGASFAGPVVLSQSGAPAGATAAFGANPLGSSTSTTLSLDTGGAAPGGSSIEILGAGPDDTYTANVQLNLAATAPAAPALSEPAQAAAGVTILPTLRWAAVGQAASYRVEVDDEPTFTNVGYTATARTNEHTLAERLSDAATYYWRVTPLNGCGAGAASATGSFTTRDRVDLLLVDDTVASSGARASYTAALDALGLSYDVWYGATADDEPGPAILSSYRSVIWFGSYDLNGVPLPGSETALGSWLDSGRCLILSAQELYARREFTVTPFMRGYLGVGAMADDSGHTTVTPVAGGLFDGMGTLPLTFTGSNFSDHMAPNAGGVLQLTGNGTRGSGAAISRDSGAYRTLYLGFPLETLALAARQELLSRALGWCGALDVIDLGLGLEVSPADAQLLPGQPITYTLSYRNAGNATATGVRLELTVPDQLQLIQTESSGPALTPADGAGYAWAVADMAPGASGTLTVRARVSPTISAGASGGLSAAISGSGAELSSTDRARAATLRTRVPSLAFSSAAVSAAETDGSVSLTVQLSEANPYAGASVGYSLAGGTATAGSDFSLSAGALGIPAGQTSGQFSLILHGDRADDDGETVLIALGGPQGAALGAPAATTLTIGDAPGGAVNTSATGLSAAEGGATASYTLVLDRAPSADVVVTLTPDAQVTLSATSVTFTPASWATPQTITVTAVDDAAVEGAHSGSVGHSVASADGRFDGYAIPAATVSIADNDGAAPEYMVYLPAVVR